MILADQPTIFDRSKIQVFVSSRDDGNMKYEKGDDAAKNMAIFAELNQLDPNKYVVMRVDDAEQWDVIREVTADDAGAGAAKPETRISADALVTAQPNLALLLPIADCCPVVLYDSAHNVAALVHLGWKSSEANLVTKVVNHLQRTHATNPSQLVAYLGPCIKPESYVFEDRPRQADKPEWQAFVQQQANGWSIDIVGYNRQQLVAAGVLTQNIQISAIDTAVSNDYFSNYRAAKQDVAQAEGRFAVVACLV